MKSFAAYSDGSVRWDKVREEARSLLERLFPICRSITGDGVRRTLATLRRTAGFSIREVPSGTRCYDWKVPDEWNISDAYIADAGGRRLVDFKKSNLHVVSYSIPVDRCMPFRELEKHLFTLPSMPYAIPYRTSYYHRNWGFCLAHRDLSRFDRKEKYRVRIDSEIKPGALTFGEDRIEGSSNSEFLISTYCCHPSLANDNLSGQVLWALLLRELKRWRTFHSYRFFIGPETIGAITYLSRNEKALKQVSGGLIPTTVAGPGRFGYKKTFKGDSLIDRAVLQTFRERGIRHDIYPFDVYGSDERQYSSQYFRIPVGTICKGKYGEYASYHTSRDDLKFIRPGYLIETLRLYLECIHKLETDRVYRSLHTKGEPMLGKRGLYPTTGGHVKQKAFDAGRRHAKKQYNIAPGAPIYGSDLDALRWLIFLCDGSKTILDIAESTGIPARSLYNAAEKLLSSKLLERIGDKR